MVRQRVTRAQVYAAFMEQWWDNARRKPQHPGLPVDFDGPRSYANFSLDLAVEMLARGELAAESTSGVYTRGGIGSRCAVCGVDCI